MRWFTCTPIAFGGGADFFARDSGLMCRGFQAIGCESNAVMPGQRMPEDEADLIRTEFGNLESADWWKGHGLDGVVLYAWGSPKFRKVAAAIREAGIFLVLNQDNGGLISPLAGFRGWLEEQWILTGSRLAFFKRVVRGMTAGLLVTDPLRAAHLKQGDVIACVSPEAARHYRKLCRVYGGKALADRVRVIPHAVEARFGFGRDATRKVRQIACVGRWSDEVQKRPRLMGDVLTDVLGRDPGILIEIAGERTPLLDGWHRSLPGSHQSRVRLRGRVERDELAEIFRRSQVFYSPSAFESFGIAAGEALCSGCSVVAGRSVSMSAFEWFVSTESGELAVVDDTAGHCGALLREIQRWENGERDPLVISGIWCGRLHAERVAAAVMECKTRGTDLG